MLRKSAVLFLTMVISVFSVTSVYAVGETTTIKITADSNVLVVDNERRVMDTAAYIDDNSRIMVPLSHLAFAFGVAEARGVGWDWDDSTKTATIHKDSTVITVQVNNTNMKVNGGDLMMDTVAVIRDSRIFIPLRFVGEALDFTFTWDAPTRIAVASRGQPKTAPPESNVFDPERDGYCFSSLGYSSEDRVPLQTYTDMLGKYQGEHFYSAFTEYTESSADMLRKVHGEPFDNPYTESTESSFGFASTALLFFTQHLRPADYQSGAANVFALNAPNSSKAELTKLIERFQIARLLPKIVKTEAQNRDQLSALVSALENGGEPVALILNDPSTGSHSLLAYKAVQGNSGYTVSVYDSAGPGKEHLLQIDNSLSSWEYKLTTNVVWNSGSNKSISFIPSSLIAEETKRRTMASDIFLTFSPGVTVTNSNDTRLNAIPSVTELLYREAALSDGAGNSQPTRAYSVPSDIYHFKFQDYLPNAMAIALSNGRRYLSIQTTSGPSFSGSVTVALESANLFQEHNTHGGFYHIEYLGDDIGPTKLIVDVISSHEINVIVSGGRMILSGTGTNPTIFSGGEYIENQVEGWEPIKIR